MNEKCIFLFSLFRSFSLLYNIYHLTRIKKQLLCNIGTIFLHSNITFNNILYCKKAACFLRLCSLFHGTYDHSFGHRRRFLLPKPPTKAHKIFFKKGLHFLFLSAIIIKLALRSATKCAVSSAGRASA